MATMLAGVAALALGGAATVELMQCADRTGQFSVGIVIAPSARAVAAPGAASASKRGIPAARAGASTMVLSY